MTVLGWSSFAAAQGLDLFPTAPEDASVVGPRPVFRIGYSGVDESELRELRFRITLRDETDREGDYSFDQRNSAAGWAPGDEGQVLFHPQRPLRDGSYEWRVWAWNGVEWTGGRAARKLRVDSVAPADVRGLRVELDRGSGRLVLRWNPVAEDRLGAPEFVARYHVYRYDGPPFRPVASHRVAASEIPEATLADEPLTGPGIAFFRVTAVDAAGNEPGAR